MLERCNGWDKLAVESRSCADLDSNLLGREGGDVQLAEGARG